MVQKGDRLPSPPEQHPRWRNTGRALAPPLLSANVLHKSPAEGAGYQTGSTAAIAPSKPSLQPAPSAPNPVHIPHAVTPGGAVLHPGGANPQPAAPLALCQPALWQSRRGCRPSNILSVTQSSPEHFINKSKFACPLRAFSLIIISSKRLSLIRASHHFIEPSILGIIGSLDDYVGSF